ncbi:PREDICTED: tRNA (adenine(58)-N(1))-methyltransferase catalytic subunit TRMT61A [Ceratosolen solmsi marchali]|uniref:tRNA (adenine(58)-N(1))-methyltransferase catalytic subunit TRMT61A n=1 Tax=Ceratosolen solmsi marchali TaxID=326594 RepID=A0AAJ7DZY2_9HYME|nr:PREDICTED: tRNA (adenine(58)-N(1))-methyltransferase catalytic subunit TRMT61A [Ceratosolen solmsi marchali]
MSFKNNKEFIEIGDVVTLYINPNNMHQIEVKDKIVNKKGELVDNVFQTTYGALKVLSLVGIRYGSKVDLSRGWAYVLQPTPELWTLTLPHRTQIIYTPDISLIIYLLDLVPGSIVIETGTGSASLSHALIRTVRPNGHLHTFDFHEQRVVLAQEEFKNHGIDEFVTVKHRDVCTEGFGDELDDMVDAVFLDLPHPWLTIDFAIKSLKRKGGKLCSFSPCIEQVQRTCAKLSSMGFISIETYECLQRELTVQQKNLSVLNLAYLRDKTAENVTKFDEPSKLTTVSHPSSTPGHTGFITIAILPPECIDER